MLLALANIAIVSFASPAGPLPVAHSQAALSPVARAPVADEGSPSAPEAEVAPSDRGKDAPDEGPALGGEAEERTHGEVEVSQSSAMVSTARRRKTVRRPADVSQHAWLRRDVPWIRRWRPERNVWELGFFGGVFVPSTRHDLYDPLTAPPEPFWQAAPDIGLRLGYYPLRALGVETEFSAVPSRMRTLTNDFAFVYGFRGHVVAQLPFSSITPFFLAGYGLLGVRSHVLLLGDDIDPAFHYGGGVKIHVTRRLALRVDARNIISAAEGLEDSGVPHLQVTGGLTLTFGRSQPAPVPKAPPPVDPDRDRDGIVNEVDQCPDEAGLAPHGCPDRDGDTFIDREDACPETPGVAPQGCPLVDTDRDGIFDDADACIDAPETWNGHQDVDGCPDELPPEVKEFSGKIPGIEFDFRQATIRPVSKPKLDRAAEILREYPELRVKIVGHTDDVGTDEFNLELSRARAEAVKQYLVSAGIDASRITTEGRGSSQPLVPNTSAENRAENRRIEFELLSERTEPATPSEPAAPTEPAETSVPAEPATPPGEAATEPGAPPSEPGAPPSEPGAPPSEPRAPSGELLDG